MKIKLKDKQRLITEMFCFKLKGYDSTVINELNNGKQVEVEKIPLKALGYIEEVKAKKTNKKESK